MFNLKRDVAKGSQAVAIQREVGPILDEMRQTVYKQIDKSNFFQKGERENCYKMLRAISLFEDVLHKRIQAKAMADHKLKQVG